MPFTMGESFVLVAPQRREMLRCNGCYDIFRQLFGGRATGLVRHLCIPILPARENLTVPVSTYST